MQSNSIFVTTLVLEIYIEIYSDFWSSKGSTMIVFRRNLKKVMLIYNEAWLFIRKCIFPAIRIQLFANVGNLSSIALLADKKLEREMFQ